MQDSPPMQVLLSDLSNTGFELMPAYPNPLSMSANPFTRLRYRLPAESSVQLAVYDMLGRKVATLVNGYQNAGVYETAWYPMTDGVDLQSGNYFIRMQAGSFTTTQKIAVVR